MVVSSFLFSEIDTDAGYAIPTADFWDLWNSPKRNLVIRLRFIPMPIGLELGAPCKWIVRLPSHVSDYVSYNPPSKTRSIDEIFIDSIQ